jgi:hypothetical protein
MISQIRCPTTQPPSLFQRPDDQSNGPNVDLLVMFFSPHSLLFSILHFCTALFAPARNHSLTHSLTHSLLLLSHVFQEQDMATTAAMKMPLPFRVLQAGIIAGGGTYLSSLLFPKDVEVLTHSLTHNLTHYLPHSPSIHCIMHLRTCCLTWPTTW